MSKETNNKSLANAIEEIKSPNFRNKATMEEYVEEGRKLKELIIEIRALDHLIQERHGKKFNLYHVMENINHLRNVLESRMSQEHPDDYNLDVFYGDL